MKMKKMILALCLSAGLCPGGIIGVYGQENPAMPDGPWSGKVDTGSLAMNLTFNFENSGDGLACTLDSPDQGIKGIEAIVEAYMEDSVRVQMPSISASYGGRIARDTNGMPKRIEENRWIDSFITLDPREYIEDTECPVFAANGSLDCQVIAESNLGTLRELLGNRPEDFIREYGELNHLFQHCKTGNPTEYPEITETFATEVLSDITGWLLSLPEE